MTCSGHDVGKSTGEGPAVERHDGMIEKGVQDVTAMVRTVKLGLESRIGAAISEIHSVSDWMVPHAAWLINSFSVGYDG